MPARTPDVGVNRFEIRTGVNGIPVLGGIYRAGDPATIPPNKQHMAVNVRITPSGMVSRPGMTQVFDTSVAECIDGLTAESQVISTLILYPGGGSPSELIFAPDDPLHLGAPIVCLMNPMSFKVIFPGGGDTSYSEYAAVLAGLPAGNNTWSPILEPKQPPTNPDPFVWMGRIHVWVNNQLCRVDLPERTLERAANCQRFTGADPIAYELYPEWYEEWDWGCDKFPIGNFLAPFPRDYPVGITEVVYTPTNPFAGGEVLASVLDQVLVPLRRDSLEDEPGVREILYFLCLGDANTLALVEYDGAFQRTIFTRASCDPAPPLGPFPPPQIGRQMNGPWVVCSHSGGTVYGGYMDEDGTWQVLANVLHVLDHAAVDQPVVPKYWGAIKDPTGPGGGQIAVIGEVSIYAPPTGPVQVWWVMEMDGSDLSHGFNRVVGYYKYCEIGPHCTCCPLSRAEYHHISARALGNYFYLYVTPEVFDMDCPEGLGICSYESSGLWSAGVTGSTITMVEPGTRTGPFPWVEVVGGTIYFGGDFEIGGVRTHEVQQVIGGVGRTVFTETTGASTAGVSHGCIPTVPAGDTGEGYGSENPDPIFTSAS